MRLVDFVGGRGGNRRHWLMGGACPSGRRGGRVGDQLEVGGDRTPLPPFANASHADAVTEMDGVPLEVDQLGEAQACLSREQQQRVIAVSEPCRSIWSGKDRLDLGSGQEMHLALIGRLLGIARTRWI